MLSCIHFQELTAEKHLKRTEEKIVLQRLMRKNEICNRKEKIPLKQMAKKKVSSQLKIG